MSASLIPLSGIRMAFHSPLLQRCGRSAAVSGVSILSCPSHYFLGLSSSGMAVQGSAWEICCCMSQRHQVCREDSPSGGRDGLQAVM